MPQVVQAAVPFGKYDLVASLGRGGMAEIFLAHERGLDELVVIKRVLPHLSTEVRFLEMLVSEAKVASLLSHPGIVRILGLGREEGQFYLAMEYVPGWNVLTVTKAAGGKVPPLIAAAIGQQVAEALSHAHLQTDLEGRPLNLVHRDVTPGNVMVTPKGDAKLIDFGIAKAATQLTKTAPGILKGKLRFVSPEQVRQEPVDSRSDLFSLGVSLYEITTGTQPFGFTHAAQTLQAILDFEPPRPRTVIPDFPQDLEDVILRALEKHPDDRFPDAKSMADALSAALGGMDPRTDLGFWLRDLAAHKPDVLPPPRDPIGETVPLRPPRTSTKDKILAETVRLPQLKEEELAPPPKRPELAQTRPMDRQEIARHVEAEDLPKPAGAPTPPPQPRTRTAEKRAVSSAEVPKAAGTPGAGIRSRSSDRRPAVPEPSPDVVDRMTPTATASAVRSRSSDRAPVAPVPEDLDLANRLTPTDPPPPALSRPRTSDRSPVAAAPEESRADLVNRMTPTATATAPARPRTSDRSPAAVEMLPREDLATTASPPPVAADPKPRTRSADRRPASPAPSETKPSGTHKKAKGTRLPQWLVGFLLGLVGVLGVGVVGGVVYWLLMLRR